jgi:hypothetical protein
MRSWSGVFCLTVCCFAQQQPEFRAGTRLVQADVVVRDRQGPVTVLTKDDFVLFDKGKPQRISVFAATSARDPVQRPPFPPGEFPTVPC